MNQTILLEIDEPSKPKLVESLAMPSDYKDAVVIHGFPGVGLVGSIAASYLLREYSNRSKTIAGILMWMKTPLLQMYGGNLFFPVSIFDLDLINDSIHLLLATSTIPIPELQIQPIFSLLFPFYHQKGISKIISLDAMISDKPKENSKSSKKNVFVLESNTIPELGKIPQFNEGINKLDDGVLLGPTAATVLNTWYNRSFSNLIMLGETYSFEPDPLCALSLLEILNRYLSLSLNVEKMREFAKMLHEQKFNLLGSLTDTPKTDQSSYFYS
ncbi:MAG: proteasome assembly chaperone family protein [Promethearchaeota archaeon]